MHMRRKYNGFKNHSKLRDEKTQEETNNFATCDAKLVRTDTGLLTKDQEKVSF